MHIPHCRRSCRSKPRQLRGKLSTSPALRCRIAENSSQVHGVPRLVVPIRRTRWWPVPQDSAEQLDGPKPCARLVYTYASSSSATHCQQQDRTGGANHAHSRPGYGRCCARPTRHRSPPRLRHVRSAAFRVPKHSAMAGPQPRVTSLDRAPPLRHHGAGGLAALRALVRHPSGVGPRSVQSRHATRPARLVPLCAAFTSRHPRAIRTVRELPARRS